MISCEWGFSCGYCRIVVERRYFSKEVADAELKRHQQMSRCGEQPSDTPWRLYTREGLYVLPPVEKTRKRRPKSRTISRTTR